MRAFFFCAEFHDDPGKVQFYSGVITTNLDPFVANFHDEIKFAIVKKMNPTRRPERVVLKTLSLLKEI